MEHTTNTVASVAFLAWQRENGLSLSRSGRKLGVSRAMVSAINNGRRRPSLWLANRIAGLAGVDQLGWDIPIRR